MNKIPRGPRLVRSPAKSPAFSITGPEVWVISTPSSCARIEASVVLPSPGGPWKSTWSSASPLWRAAWRKIRSCSLTAAWPTNSSSAVGLSRGSSCRSSAKRSGSPTRGGWVAAAGRRDFASVKLPPWRRRAPVASSGRVTAPGPRGALRSCRATPEPGAPAPRAAGPRRPRRPCGRRPWPGWQCTRDR